MLGVKNFCSPKDKIIFVKKSTWSLHFLKFNFDMQNEVMHGNETKRLPSHFLGFLCSSFGSTRKQLCLRDPWLRWHRFGSRHAHRSGSYQEKEWKASSPPGIFSYSFPFFFLSSSQTLAERTPKNSKVCNLRKLPWRKESNLDMLVKCFSRC